MDKPASNRSLPFRLVYHEGYDLNFGRHVFPSQKYGLIRERLLATGFASEGDFVSPERASDGDLVRVHDSEWVSRLKNGTLSYHDVLVLEVPYSRKMVDAFVLAAGGTTLAAEWAVREGIGFNIGGGFHHAFAAHGEGFCAINDIAVAIRVLQHRGLVEKALVVDCDVHQGNGTAAVFANDPSVFTISIHQLNNYPAEKPPSTVDIHLPDDTADEEYLKRLGGPVDSAVRTFQPGLLVYVAGADPYHRDQLGGLSLTLEGLRARDRLVMDTALRQNVPVAIVLAGGYAVDLDDTITIHSNTAIAAKESLLEIGWRRDAAANSS